MNPSSSLATLRPDLAGSFTEFDLEMANQGFVAHEIFPVIEVGMPSGTFGRVPIEQLLKTMPTERAPGAGYNRSVWKFEPESYITQEHGHESVLDDREVKMYREFFDAEMVTVQRARRIVMQNAEIRVAAKIQNSGTHNTVGIGDEWDDSDVAIPIDDVNGAIDRLWAKGIIANALIITRKQFRALRVCDQIAEKIAAFGAGGNIKQSDITTAVLRAVFDLEHIIVAGSLKNTAGDGLAASTTGIWSDEYAAVTRIATSGDIQDPCVGRTFHYGEDGSSIGGTVETYREENVRGDVYRVRHDVQEKEIFPEAVELLSNAITI